MGEAVFYLSYLSRLCSMGFNHFCRYLVRSKDMGNTMKDEIEFIEVLE
jgi:hypothetical protein